jgi:hypothetical protein
MWAADRLHRLGISRYFQPEINECVNYVYRYIYIYIYIYDPITLYILIVIRKNQNLLLMGILKNSDIGLMRGFAGREIPRFMMLMIRPWDSGY